MIYLLVFYWLLQPLFSTPYIDKILVSVNKTPITQYEIDEELKLFYTTLGSSETPPDPKIIRKEILDKMIERKLKEEKIKALKIEVVSAEVNKALEDMARNNGMTIEQMRSFFQKKGLSLEILKNNLKIQIGWEKFIHSQAAHLMKVSAQEVRLMHQKICEKEKKTKHELIEIFYPIKNLSEKTLAFQKCSLARQSLQKTSDMGQVFQEIKNKGGQIKYLGWILEDDLTDVVKSEVLKAGFHGATQLIFSPQGYRLFFVKDTQLPGKAPLGQTRVSFIDIVAPALDGGGDLTSQLYMAQMHEEIAQSSSLHHLKKISEKFKLLNQNHENIPFSLLSNFPQPKVGTKVKFTESHEGRNLVRYRMIYKVIEAEPKKIAAADVENNLRREKLEAFSNQLIKNLKGAAIIEYKS